MLGKLTWDAIPFDEPIPLITSLVVILAIVGIAVWVWRKGWAPHIWHGYITSTDHKKIGIMYIVLALLMLVRGFANAIMMDIPAGVTVTVDKQIVKVAGPDKQAVGQFASAMRAKRKPEPYNGKGIKYVDEVIKRKQGKQFGA